jgi:hypothetical protein
MDESSSREEIWILHTRPISSSCCSKCAWLQKSIIVLSDVFVLRLHYYLDDLELTMRMESPMKDRVVVDIGKASYQISLLLMHCVHAVSALERTLF